MMNQTIFKEVLNKTTCYPQVKAKNLFPLCKSCNTVTANVSLFYIVSVYKGRLETYSVVQTKFVFIIHNEPLYQ